MNVVDPNVSFALWSDTQTPWRVQYSIPLFNEIDFEVNEGYRRIPHGGIEVGGLLYGHLDSEVVTISAFRPIECDHAAGPSFLLSESDLSKLSTAALTPSQDDELRQLVPVGWFIAHTRGPLQMTPRELEIFGQLFPGPGRVTVLVKPERFRPTRFQFLVRDESGQLPLDGAENAIILPLSGRAGRLSEPLQPSDSPASSPPPERRMLADLALESELSRAEPLTPEVPAQPSSPSAPAQEVAETPPPAPALPVFIPPVYPPRPTQVSRAKRHSGLLVTVLFLAALLGCGVGYWAYLQLPPTVITLRVQKRRTDLLIVWNPSQTQTASYSAMRVNDGRPVLLSVDQKTSGIAEVPLTVGDIKVEVVSRHWMRESRGIVRFLQAFSRPH